MHSYNTGNQIRRRYIESGIVSIDFVDGGWNTPAGSYFRRITVLDLDRGAVGAFVICTPHEYEIGDAVMVRGNGILEGADLVADVAIEGDQVCGGEIMCAGILSVMICTGISSSCRLGAVRRAP